MTYLDTAATAFASRPASTSAGVHAAGAHDLGQITTGHHGRRLVVDAALEAGGAPVHKLDGSLGLDGSHCRVHILRNDVATWDQHPNNCRPPTCRRTRRRVVYWVLLTPKHVYEYDSITTLLLWYSTLSCTAGSRTTCGNLTCPSCGTVCPRKQA